MVIDERQAAIHKLQVEIQRAEAKLEELRAAGHSRAANSDFQASIEHRRDQARETLDQLRRSSEDSWEELRGGFERTYHDLRAVIKR